MKELIGSWKTTKDLTMRVGVSVFTLNKCATVSVRQVDEEREKVLLEVDERTVDWVGVKILENFERL